MWYRNDQIGDGISVIRISHYFFEFGWSRQLLAVFNHSFDMQSKRFLGQILGFIDGLPSGNTARKVWKRYPKISFGLFMNDSYIIRHVITSLELKPRLALDAF